MLSKCRHLWKMATPYILINIKIFSRVTEAGQISINVGGNQKKNKYSQTCLKGHLWIKSTLWIKANV